MSKVLLIGFDGVSFDKIAWLVKKEKLPNFAKFIEKGCTGTMMSTIPPISAPAWASLVTGMNPGKHGIFFFLTPDEHVVLSDRIVGKTLWDIIGNSGRRVIVVNMPLTYPPYPVNGVMISGFPCPSNTLSVYPKRLTNKLNEAVPEYMVDSPHKAPGYVGMNKHEFFNELCDVTEKRLDMTLFLMKEYEWDFCVVVFTSPDRVQHVFWNEDSEYLLRYYEVLDSVLGRLDRKNEVVTFVVSDHGFETHSISFGINNWLQKQGFLKTKGALSKKETFRVIDTLRRVMPSRIKKLLPSDVRKKVRSPQIEYSHTLAYSPFPSAIISQSTCKEQIRELFYELDFVEKVYDKEEIYKGGHLKDAPDLFLALKDGYESKVWAKDVIEVVKKPPKNKTSKTGTHQGILAQKAVFMAKGKNIRKGRMNLEIVDVAPTILKIMQIPKPPVMDGKVLDIFESSKSSA